MTKMSVLGLTIAVALIFATQTQAAPRVQHYHNENITLLKGTPTKPAVNTIARQARPANIYNNITFGNTAPTRSRPVRRK